MLPIALKSAMKLSVYHIRSNCFPSGIENGDLCPENLIALLQAILQHQHRVIGAIKSSVDGICDYNLVHLQDMGVLAFFAEFQFNISIHFLLLIIIPQLPTQYGLGCRPIDWPYAIAVHVAVDFLVNTTTTTCYIRRRTVSLRRLASHHCAMRRCCFYKSLFL